jgi:hypothetical protein
MREQEISTSAAKLLRSGEEKTTKEIADYIRSASGIKVSETEVFDAFVNFERLQKVQRSNKKERFDEYKPVTTSSWILLDQNTIIPEVPSEQRLPGYIISAELVVSQPIFLSTKGLEFKNLGMPILSVAEAMEKIVLDASEDIRIACPYYDDLFVDILSKNAMNIGSLKTLSILAEKTDPILLKVRKLFPNTKLKTLYSSTSSAYQEHYAKIFDLIWDVNL